MDLQPSSLLPPVSVCNRLELHDRLPHPCRSRGIPHSVACCADTGDNEPNILPRGQSAAQIPPQSRDRSRTSAHPSRGKHLRHHEPLLRIPYRISFLDNISDSRLRHSRLPLTLPRLRPGIGRTELSVLGRALLCPSDPGQLGSHPRRKAPFHGTASQKSSARGNDRSTQCFQNTNFLGRDLESKRPC